MTSIQVDDWNSISNSINVGVIFVGTKDALNSPSGTYLTAINLASDGNPFFKKLIGLDLEGKMFTRRQHNGNWDNWVQIPTMLDIPRNVLTSDRISVGSTAPLNPQEGDIWFKR